MTARPARAVVARSLLALMLAAACPAAAGAQQLERAEIDAMDLPAVVQAVRARCGMMVTAMGELQRRHPAEVAEVPDCGGMVAATDGGPYRAMTDPALNAAITTLSEDLTALVAHGEALQAAAPARAKPDAPQPTVAAASPATPAPPTPVVPSPGPDDGPPVGKYHCYMGPTHSMVGRIWILPGRQYKILENGPIGRFRIDPASHAITWVSGSNLKLKRRGWHLPPGLGDRLRNAADSKRHAIILQEEGFDKTPFEAGNWAASSFEGCYIPSH